MRAALVSIAAALTVGVLGGGCGSKTGKSTSAPPVPASQVNSVLRNKLHLHKGPPPFSLNEFEVSGRICPVVDVITSAKARQYRPDKFTAISPNHDAAVRIIELTSGTAGAPASDCLKAIKEALGWG
jgi:hypothetical protein